jgi:hypothetical protein
MKTEEQHIKTIKTTIDDIASDLLCDGLDEEELYYELQQYLSSIEFILSEVCEEAVQGHRQAYLERQVEADMESNDD